MVTPSGDTFSEWLSRNIFLRHCVNSWNVMNPMKRPVASVLRVLGTGMILLSVVLLALLWVARQAHPEPWWRWAMYAFPAFAGLAVCLASGSLAERFTRGFEE